MSCSMGVLLNREVRNWPSNWRRTAMNGLSPQTKRTEYVPMSESKVLAPGFSRAAVEELSRLKGEPDWLLQLRLHAWETYENTPAPLGRRGDLGTQRAVANFQFQNLNPFTPSGSVLPS